MVRGGARRAVGDGRSVQDAVTGAAYGAAMTLRLGFIGIVTRDMSASLAFYRLLGAPVPEGSDEPHIDTRLEDGTVLAWDTIDLIRRLDPGYESPSGGHRIALAFDQGTARAVDATYARLTGAGYEGRTKPWDTPWGQRYATVLDPDGNSVDLFAALEN